MPPFAHGTPSRRHLAADVVGFSARVSADEEGALRAIKGHMEALEFVIGLHHGRVVKTMGDGMLVEFGSVVDAVSAAHAMQNRMGERNRDQPQSTRFKFRIGVHVGDIVADGADILGDGVNIAARLEAEAAPGGVVISARVHEDVADKLDFAFTDLGERSLKNIARPIRLYALEGAAPEAPPPAPDLPDKPSVAVLPFTNMSADAEQEYFADGLTEDIITALSHVPWIFVIARNSSFTYKGAAVDVRKVGRELGVRYVLEGSVRRAGPRVRVTGQLVDTGTGAHIWAGKMDGAVEDVFDLQDQMTGAVVGAIAPEIQTAEIARATRKRPENLTAYDHCLKGMALLNRAQVGAAATHLDAAVAADPDYAKAIAVNAWRHTLEVAWSDAGDYARHRDAAVAMARRALTLASRDPEVAAYSGYTMTFFGEDVDSGMALVRDAAERFPSFAWAWSSVALQEAQWGDPQKAFEAGARAIRLSPRDPMLFRTRFAIACGHQTLGQTEEMLAEAEQAMRLNPNLMALHVILVMGYTKLGHQTAAKAASTALLSRYPAFTISRYETIIAPMRTLAPRIQEIKALLREAGLPE